MAGLIALLFASLLLGIVARRVRAFPPATPHALNAVILYIALPALVLKVLRSVHLSVALGFAASMLWLQFVAALGLFLLLGRIFKWSRSTIGAVTLTAGLSNTAYVGLPVIEAVFGHNALGIGVMVDQLGSFLVLSTLGMATAAALSGSRTQPRMIAKRVILFPPFLALVAALALHGVAFPSWADLTLQRLGDLLTPLALFSVGFQLEVGGLRGRISGLGAGLLFKLVISPILAGLVFALLTSPASLEWKVTVLQCAMPPMVTGGILAAQYDLDPPLAAAMVGLGIPVSAGTLAAVIAYLH